MGKQMTLRKDKWSLRRINGRYGSFVTMSVRVNSYPTADFSPVIEVNLPWL